MNRVVVTGIGMVTPIGIGTEQFWSSLIKGQSGVAPITLFDASSFPVRIGGEVKNFDAQRIANHFPQAKLVKDRKVLLALCAAQQAVGDSCLSGDDLNDAALHVGVGLEVFHLDYLTPYAGSDDMGGMMGKCMLSSAEDSPMQTSLDTTAVILGERYGFRAGKFTNCSACAAGAQTIGRGWQMLRRGNCRVAIAGGTDSMLNPLGLGGFSLLRVLSSENDQPQRACRPFNATRKGTVLGEGSAFVVMETLEHASSRNANIYAEVLGYGSSMDAYRVSDPDPDGAGAVQSMKAAMKSAELSADRIDCVSAHGTGTVKNDIVETKAIKEALGRRAYEIPVHAVKSMTGHMIAASGATEAVTAVLTISKGLVPPTINLEKTDEECDLDYVPLLA